MDGSRFDSLARAMANPTTRRRFFRLLVGAVAAGIAFEQGNVAADVSASSAARRHPFWNRGGPCATSNECGQLVPCTDGLCTPIKCDIDGQVWNVGPKPGNGCQYCLPERDPAIPDAWSVRPLGTSCNAVTAEVAGDAECLSARRAYCTSDGECVPGPQREGTLCGIGQTCCGATCCGTDECCTAAGVCEACGPHCVIDYVTYLEGAGHPDGSCQVCDPSEFSFWTTAANQFSCGPNRDQVCCAGSCCPPGQCCGPTGQCGACESECESNGGWCGPNHNQACCNGQCCAYGTYCGHPDSCDCCAQGEVCNGGVCEPS